MAHWVAEEMPGGTGGTCSELILWGAGSAGCRTLQKLGAGRLIPYKSRMLKRLQAAGAC